MFDKVEHRFDRRYGLSRVKPLIDIASDILVERGPCKWCGIEKFMGHRQDVYCSEECRKLGKQASVSRAQTRLKQRRERAKLPPQTPTPTHDNGLSFLERRVRAWEDAGAFDEDGNKACASPSSDDVDCAVDNTGRGESTGHIAESSGDSIQPIQQEGA